MPISYVQTGAFWNGAVSSLANSPVTTLNSFSSTTTAGNVLVAVAIGNVVTTLPSTVTVTGASFGTWVQGPLFTDVATKTFASMWYCANCNAVAASTNINVTVAWAGGAQGFDFNFAIFELSGATSTAYDTASGGNAAASGTPNTGSITPSFGDFILAAVFQEDLAGNAAVAGSGYTLIRSANDALSTSVAYQYLVSSTSSTQTPTFANNSANPYVAQAWAFKALTSGYFSPRWVSR